MACDYSILSRTISSYDTRQKELTTRHACAEKTRIIAKEIDETYKCGQERIKKKKVLKELKCVIKKEKNE